MRKQNGFTLIELMIVVAIVGILAAIAIPAYQDFQVRSKISEVLATMGACKTTVAEYFASNGDWQTLSGTPISADLCGDAAGDNSQYVALITVGATGIITATSQNTGNTNADGDITMEPQTAANAAVAAGDTIHHWTCESVVIPPRFMPGSCQG